MRKLYIFYTALYIMTRRTRKNTTGGLAVPSDFIYPTMQISTQPNTDNSYKEIGIIHITDSQGINYFRNVGTDIANLFGRKGFDNTLVDRLRNDALNQLKIKITANQKICSLRMEIQESQSLFMIHLYGTLLEKSQQQQQQANLGKM